MRRTIYIDTGIEGDPTGLLKYFRYGFFIIMGIGVVAVISACGMAFSTGSFISSTHAAVGKVIGFQDKTAFNRQILKTQPDVYPDVEFTDDAGNTVDFASGANNLFLQLRTGDRVPVIYEQDNPSHAEINAFLPLWLVPLAIGLFGAGFFLVGLLAVRASGGFRR